MNNNGFTLVELLAVIVILAILVLFATPAIASVITTANKNAFKSEVISFAKSFNGAYTARFSDKPTKEGISKVERIRAYNLEQEVPKLKTYSFYCVTLEQLADEGFISKRIGKDDFGILAKYVPDDGDEITVLAISENGMYIGGRLSNILKDETKPTTTSSISKAEFEAEITCDMLKNFIPTDDMLFNNELKR